MPITIYDVLVDELMLDVKSAKHHSTAAAWCVCGWQPDPIPRNPDGSGDGDEMERMARVHRFREVMLELKESEALGLKVGAS